MLDTRTARHPLTQRPTVARRVVAVCISAITQAELRFGLARQPDAKTLHAAVGEFLRRVDVLPWDAAAAEVYGPARAAAQREGRALAPMDLALSVEAVLVANDHDFGPLACLVVEDWTEDS